MNAVSYAPRTGAPVNSAAATTPAELAAVTRAAAQAADGLAQTSPGQRRAWLHALAAALEANRDELVERADEETALGPERLRGEIARTADMMRFYGDVAREGSYLRAALDDAAGLRRLQVPVGPVAVFGASNFPFVLGVVGHDTAASIAAGCPVVAKAHDAHIGLSQRLAELASATLADCGAPAGTYNLVIGFDAGVNLVKDPAIAAVAFTGSERGGRAIWRAAQDRTVPIPVYAEMGTVNPVVVTPSAVDDLETIAAGFVGCYTSCAGQYCSKPGLLFAPKGSGAADRVAAALATIAPAPIMLTRAIADSVRAGLREFAAVGAVSVLETGGSGAGWAAPAAVLRAPVSAIAEGSRLLEECFGAVAVVTEYADEKELIQALKAMQPALVAAVWTPTDDPDPLAGVVVRTLADNVGRVVVNGWTTGANPSWAQQHGGPWPATSNAQGTSIGADALYRFVRPLAYQGVPDALLPPPVQHTNPWEVTRRVNGVLEQSPHIVP